MRERGGAVAKVAEGRFTGRLELASIGQEFGKRVLIEGVMERYPDYWAVSWLSHTVMS